MTDIIEGEVHTCERLNLGIVNRHLRDAMDAIELVADFSKIWICGRAVTVGLFLDLAEATQPPMFSPESDSERFAEGWKGHYRGIGVRQVNSAWNPAMRLDELWIITDGNPVVTIIRDNEVLDGHKVRIG